MSDFYELITPGSNPIKVKEVKSFLRIDHKADDDMLAALLSTALLYGENYTGRDFRANTWKVTTDSFVNRQCLRRSQVDTITTVKYTVSSSLSTIASSVYYLKKGLWSEVLLQDGQAWPSDLDNIEAGIEITFATVAIPDQKLAQCKTAMLRHIASMYEVRGDCDEKQTAIESGASILYGQVSIPRI